MNDASNRSAPSTDVVKARNETLSKLHALIESVGGLKKWLPETTQAAEELLAEVIFSEVSGPREQASGLSLAQDLPITVIESVFEKHWPNLPEERKGGLIRELMKLNSDRSLTRQVAVAQKVAQFDRHSAAHILQELMEGTKAKTGDFWPGLSKEKKELIRSRFGNREWVYFNLPDELAMRSLLAGFVEALTEVQTAKATKKSQRSVYDFARWALSTLKRIRVDDATRDLVRERVMQVAADLPIEWKKELHTIASDIPMSDDSDSEAREARLRDTSDSATQSATSIPAASPGALSHELTPRAAAVALIERKRAEVAQRRASAELLQNDIGSVDGEIGLIRKLLDDAELTEALSAELEQVKRQVDGLKSTIGKLESDLASTRAAHVAAAEASSSLTFKNDELKKALAEERNARAVERRELEEEIERTVRIKLDGFRERLGKSLRPIFKNKKKSDDQEPTSRLCEFLRGWFDEVEEQIIRAGIQL